MTNNKVYSYAWHLDDAEEENSTTIIKIFGLNETSESVCIRVEDFTPFVYAELPSEIPWTLAKAQSVGDKLDELLGDKKPIKKQLMYKKKLYFAHLNPNKTVKTFPYLFLSFSSYSHIKNISYKIRNAMFVKGVGHIKLKIHEQDASPVLQLTSYRNLPTAGWIEFNGEPVLDNKITSCAYEYVIRWKHLKPSSCDKIAYPLVMGFDIEVNSSVITAMPKSERPKDKVFQISCVFFKKDTITHTFLLSLGNPDQQITGENIIIRCFETESDLLLGYAQIINEFNPNVICGYNIMNFDIPYMIDRSKLNLCSYDFARHGFLIDAPAKEKNIKWSSSAYGDQIFKYLDAEGRVFVDLLPLIKRDYKMDNYKLKTISTFFLGETKDPLSVKGIFKCYRLGVEKVNGEYTEKGKKAMAICGKYCCKDSELVVNLFNKLQTWIGLCEMAKTCNVPIFYLYTQGQQIKVYSQLYKYCMHNDIIVEKDGYIANENEHYQGATIFDPIPGVYDKVLPFDFASLYPSTIIAYNIDYSTLALDSDTHIKDSECNVLEWDEHTGCSHDKTVRKIKPKYVLCGHRRFRFLKEPKGVMPTVLQNLLSARENTRKYMKLLKKAKLSESEIETIKQLIPSYSPETTTKEDISALLDVLEKRQLAYKVSANSMYGAMGVSKGYLPFMPGAMSTTAMGRQNILKVSQIIPEKYGGKLVYGDTDTLLPDCPVLIWDKSKIEYKTMEELSDGNWKPTITGKEVSNAKKGLFVWSDVGFTKIKQVIRHAITKPLIRVLTHVGSVECTLDHSLLWENGDAAKASDVKVGSKLCISELPLPKDTPKKPIYINKLSEKVIEDYVIPEVEYENMTAELAFVWGMFYAEGSCGTYKYPYGKSSVWAISGQDNKLLTRCVLILNKYEEHLQFKILDTMKSSKANKLVPYCKERGSNGKIVEFVNRYRDLFYDCRRSKRVPGIILNCPFEIRQAFFMGYYAGDGSKKDPAISLSNKGAIGSAGLFYIMRSIGYQVSINTRADKPTIYKLTGSTPEKAMRYEPNAVKKIYPTAIYNSLDPLIDNEYDKQERNNQPEYIYDIETENHHFAAGVGQLIVHNSNYVIFPHLKTAEENWEYAEKVASEISSMFPAPIKLEFEQVIYWRFFILTKKRYMYKKCDKNGVIDEQIGKKGVLLARRDTSLFIRNVYAELIMKIFNKETEYNTIHYVFDEIFKLASSFYSYKNFIITKSIKNCEGPVVPFINEKGVKKGKKGDYTVPLLSDDPKKKQDQFTLKKCTNENDYYLHCLPAVVQLAEKMRMRGQRVDIGSRLEYVITNQGSVNGKQYEKIEDSGYFSQFSSVIKIDYMYYLNSMTKPFDAVLNIMYKDQNLVTKCYKLIEIKYKLLKELQDLFRPKIQLIPK